MRRGLFLLALVSLGGCAPKVRPGAAQQVVVVPPGPEDLWRNIASADDRARLEQLPARFGDLSRGIRAPQRYTVTIGRTLLDPAAAQPWVVPTPGVYRCRVVRLSGGRGSTTVRSFRPFFCYVQADADSLALTKGTGSDRPGGRIFPDSARRMIFLGASAVGNTMPAYDAAATTNRIGMLERIESFRWRLVLDRRQDNGLDVLDLWPDSASLPVTEAIRL